MSYTMKFYTIPRPPRDSQKSKVYAAEEAIVVRKWGAGYMSLPEIRKFYEEIRTSRWARKRFPWWHATRVKTESRRWAWGVRHGNVCVIDLPQWARQKAVVLHELAHGLQPIVSAAHGPEFVAIYCELVLHFMGPSHYDKLVAAFQDAGVEGV